MPSVHEISMLLSVYVAQIHARSGVDLDMLARLMDASVGRIMRKDCVRGGAVDTGAETVTQIMHIGDWIAGEAMENAAWLARVNRDGVPTKLAKAGNLTQLIDEVNKSQRRKRTYGTAFGKDDDLEMVHDSGNGYAIYRLRTLEELDREGMAMGHCVGQGAYDLGVAKGSTAIYSLRDAYGKSHVTVEIDQVLGSVEQIKGKQNKVPKPEYMRRLIGWLGPDVTVPASEIPPGFAIDAKTGLTEIAALKSGDVFYGDLAFNLDKEKDHLVVPLAEGVRVTGNVFIDGGDLIDRIARSMSANPLASPRDFLPSLVVPDGLNVGGTLKVRGCDVSFDKLAVGRLHFVACLVSRLPSEVSAPCEFESTYTRGEIEDTIFGSDVTMEKCGDFAFGAGTSIAGDLYISVSKKPHEGSLRPSVRVGDGTRVGGEVRITRSDVAFLGAFACDGNLTIIDCGDVVMPASLSVSGNIIVKDSFIDGWPDEMEVGGTETYDSVDSIGQMDTVPPGFTCDDRAISNAPRF